MARPIEDGKVIATVLAIQDEAQCFGPIRFDEKYLRAKYGLGEALAIDVIAVLLRVTRGIRVIPARNGRLPVFEVSRDWDLGRPWTEEQLKNIEAFRAGVQREFDAIQARLHGPRAREERAEIEMQAKLHQKQKAQKIQRAFNAAFHHHP